MANRGGTALSVLWGLACCSFAVGQVPAPARPDADSPDDIVVRAYPPHCKPKAGDPLDLAGASAPRGREYYRVEPDAATQFRIVHEASDKDSASWITGAEYWQRAGSNLGNYIFRVPTDGAPLCIGEKKKDEYGSAHLRRIIKSGSYRCKAVRFTVFAATRQADAIFWINVEHHNPTMFDIHGNHGWTPISLSIGPIGLLDSRLMYGAILMHGDVWFYQPKLEVVPDRELPKHIKTLVESCKNELITRAHMITDHQALDVPLPGDEP